MIIAALKLGSILTMLAIPFTSKNIESRPKEMNEFESPKSIYSFKLKGIAGNEIDFSKFKGKKILIMNVASKCGYTPQYEDWEKFHKAHPEIVILGFPANQFGGQEPGSNEEIAQFCKLNYGVSFQMMEKVVVKGKEKCELYQWLTDKNLNGWNDKEPSWNFCKYLINEKGELVKFFASGVKPDNKEFLEAIK
ncbi:MAG: hypothetical protein RIR51_1607 [Bacteroidota bacterium]